MHELCRSKRRVPFIFLYFLVTFVTKKKGSGCLSCSFYRRANWSTASLTISYLGSRYPKVNECLSWILEPWQHDNTRCFPKNPFESESIDDWRVLDAIFQVFDYNTLWAPPPPPSPFLFFVFSMKRLTKGQMLYEGVFTGKRSLSSFQAIASVLCGVGMHSPNTCKMCCTKVRKKYCQLFFVD